MLIRFLLRHPWLFVALSLAFAVPPTVLFLAAGAPIVQFLIGLFAAPLWVFVGLSISIRLVRYLLRAGRRNARRDIIRGLYLDSDPRGRIPDWMLWKIGGFNITPVEVYVEAYNRCVMSSQICPRGHRNPRAPHLRVA